MFTVVHRQAPEAPRAAPGQSKPERRARRRARALWVWTGLGMALLALVPLGTSIVSTQMIAVAGSGPDRDEVNAFQQTQFGEAGLSYMSLHGTASFNLARLPQRDAFIGLDQDGVVTSHAVGSYSTVVYSGASATDHWTTDASRVAVVVTGGMWRSLEVETAAYGFADFTHMVGDLQVQSDAFGWGVTDGGVDKITAVVAAQVRLEQESSVFVGSGTSFGMPVSGRIDCSATGTCLIVTTFDVG